MFTNRLFYLLLIAAMLVLTSCAQPGSATTNPADRFAGQWSGTMNLTDIASRNEDVIMTIPNGCVVGGVCGDSYNITINCTWEITLHAINGDIFEYTFSKTLGGECPALTS